MYDTNKIRWGWVGLGFVTFIVLAGLAGQTDYEDAVREEQLYCNNVALYKQTQGEQGWPDYREVYNTMCVKNSEKNQNS